MNREERFKNKVVHWKLFTNMGPESELIWEWDAWLQDGDEPEPYPEYGTLFALHGWSANEVDARRGLKKAIQKLKYRRAHFAIPIETGVEK